jgi:dodecin
MDARPVVHDARRSRHQRAEPMMTERTYAITEIVGTSPDGVDDAVRNGIAKANQTLRNLDWFEVTEIRGHLVDGAVEHFQVVMKLGFRMEE